MFGIPQHGPVDYRRAALHGRESFPRPVQPAGVIATARNRDYVMLIRQQASYAGPEFGGALGDELSKVQAFVVIVQFFPGDGVQAVAVQFQPVKQRVAVDVVARAGRAGPFLPVRFRGREFNPRPVVPMRQCRYAHL